MFFKPGQGKMIQLQEFAPDKPHSTPGILLDAVNAQPTESGFRPMASGTVIGNALPFRPIGSMVAYYADESAALFVAVENQAHTVDFLAFTQPTWTAVGSNAFHVQG